MPDDPGKSVLLDTKATTRPSPEMLGIALIPVASAPLGATETARGQGKSLAVVLGDPAPDAVARIFEVTGLADVLPTRATRAEAHEIFAQVESQ